MRNVIIQACLFLATLAVLFLAFLHRDYFGNWLFPLGILIACIPMAIRWVVIKLGGPDIAIKRPKSFGPN
jgi:hypothetical protein